MYSNLVAIFQKKFLLVFVSFLGAVLLAGLYLSNQKGEDPLTRLKLPKVDYIEGKFLTYGDIDVRNKSGYVCVESKQEFKDLIVENIRKFNISPELESKKLENGEYISTDGYWREYPEYFSFWPGNKSKALKCSYFESTGILGKIEEDKPYELGYFKEAINKDSFDQLVSFLVRAKIAPTITTPAFNFSINSYSSKTTEKKDMITRIDKVAYSVFNDTPPYDSSKSKQNHTYSISLIDGAVYYTGDGRPFYPFN